MHESGFVEDLALVLGVAAITGFLFSRLKLPSILGYLLAGLIVGPYLPIPLAADMERVHALSEFGVVLVMFAVGLEFRLAKFIAVLPVSGVTGFVEMGALLTAGYFLGVALGWTDTRALFLGACMCISSTMAVSKILEKRPIPDSNRRLVYGVLVLQDVAAIALIAVMTAVSRGHEASFQEVVTILGKLSAALVALIAVGMFFVPRFMRALERTRSKEVLVVGAVGLCFSFALVAQQFGYSSALGAFIGGILVAESGLGHQVDSATSSVRDMFVAVFFVSIGMSVDPKIAWDTLPISLAVLGVIVVTQFISVTSAGTASGNGLIQSVTAGLALGQIGEFAFIIGAIGVASGVLDNEFQSILVTVAVLSTFSTSLALRFRGPIIGLIQKAIPDRLNRVLVFYESWWQQLREPGGEQQNRVRRIVAGIVLDVSVMAAIILSWQAWRKEIGAFLVGALQLGEEVSQTLAVLALGLSLLPLQVTLFFSARALARRLSDRVFPAKQSSGRGLLTAAIWVLVVATIGIPGTLVLGRVVGIAYVWPAFLFAVLVSGWIAWRRLGTLETEIQSGGMMMLQAIAGQGFSELERATRPTLPGMRNLREVTLVEGNFAVQKSLADIELRSSTGASVVALKDAQDATSIPTGAEILSAGTTLFVAGSTEAQDCAEAYLIHGPQDSGESSEDKESDTPSTAGE